MMISNFKRMHKQSGVTMIEALVSLFIFSIGALGVAALQTTTLVRSDDTKQRSIALWKAQELVDRMRSTKTVIDPDGSIPAYITLINNGKDNIGVMSSGNEFNCANFNITQRCDQQDGVACNIDQLVSFDIWSVMCDPNTGIATQTAAVGSVGLRNVELALSDEGNYYHLYFEWLSRSANNDTDLSGSVVTSLCGENISVDSRLDAYCVRFQ